MLSLNPNLVGNKLQLLLFIKKHDLVLYYFEKKITPSLRQIQKY